MAPELPAEAAAPSQGAGTILIIDDEELVRRTARLALEHHGYRVMVAETAREGIELFRGRASEIALVLLDVNMPGMNGEEAVGQFTSIRPDIPVLVSSGYNEGLAARRFAGMPVAGFIPKPYTSRELAEKINRVLAATGRKA
jgi:CheY-like chemotaxis protein